jgi:hypothetical protein
MKGEMNLFTTLHVLTYVMHTCLHALTWQIVMWHVLMQRFWDQTLDAFYLSPAFPFVVNPTGRGKSWSINFFVFNSSDIPAEFPNNTWFDEVGNPSECEDAIVGDEQTTHMCAWSWHFAL